MRLFTSLAGSVCGLAMVANVALAQSSSALRKQAVGIDPSSLDRSVDPCVDFYQFACGTWMKNNPIPSDQSRWGRFAELTERNREVLHQILEKAAQPGPPRDPITQQIGDYYAACMDDKAIDARGARPLQAEFDRITSIKTLENLITTLAHLHGIRASGIFEFGASVDLHDSTRFVASLDQGGLGMPDRENYLKNDPKSVDVRNKYREHVTSMFKLLGDPADVAASEAKTVLDIETSFAKASMDRTRRRDPKNRDHKMTRPQLAALAPDLDLQLYFKAAGAPAFDSLNVVSPEFFRQINQQLKGVPLDSWKTYLRWHTLHSFATALSTPFVEEDFRFYSHVLTGQQELEARWKRCVRATDADLGEALGQPFVKETFGEDDKLRMLQMVHTLETAMEMDIKNLPWMSEETKQKAIEKLRAIDENIGYPNNWRDYSSLKIVRGDFAGNQIRANAFETGRQLGKINGPVDRKEWSMTPPTVNAYANQSRVTINFPAGILQPPFFDRSMDDAVNYGGIGVVIGHEMTHLFDDQGAKSDSHGNLNNWWTEKDAREFDARTSCVANQYGQFVAVDDVRLNGRLTLGENTADNGGLKIAYMALREALQSKPQSPMDGFTPAQRFFLGYAQIWCENRTDESARLRAQTDSHSPGRYRVNGAVSNSSAFQEAFSCKAGQPMVRQNACRVW